MNGRTIQHPGIEIREIDMSEYQNEPITTNNAYVMGFADKGPIYDYSWITTRNEFIRIYGEPTTEAEKYLYYAVESILNNGGTPIVGRMPYDNKQCKAYKALKIKYAGYKKNTDTNELEVFGWNNDLNFAGISSLIDLNDVKSYLNPNGWTTTLETLANQNISYYYDDDEIINATSAQLTTLDYNFLLRQLSPTAWSEYDLENESDTNEFLAPVYNNLTNAEIKLNSIISYCNVPVKSHNKAISAVLQLNAYNNLSGYLETVSTEISNIANNAATSAHIGFAETLSGILTLNNKTFIEIVDLYNDIAKVYPALSATTVPKTVQGLIDDTTSTEIAELKSLNLQGQALVTKFTEFNTNIAKARTEIIKYNLGLDETEDSVTAEKILSQYDLLNTYLNAESKTHDKTPCGVLSTLTQNPDTKSLFKDLADKADLFDYNISGNISGSYYKSVTFSVITGYYHEQLGWNYPGVEQYSGTFNYTYEFPIESLTDKLEFADMQNVRENAKIQLADWIAKNELPISRPGDAAEFVPVVQITQDAFDNAVYHKATASDVFVYTGKLALTKILDILNSDSTIKTTDITKSSYSFEYIMNLVYTSLDKTSLHDLIQKELQISSTAVDFYNRTYEITCPKDAPHNWRDNDSLWQNILVIGRQHTKQCYVTAISIEPNARILINGKSPFDLNLNEEIIQDILSGSNRDALSDKISDIGTNTKKFIKTLDKSLAQIFNDPYFKKYDGTLKGQAIVDAALLTDPAVDYKYCVYLDSKECTISNEQYDDLVVGNTFTKADRQVSKYGEDIDSANFIIVDKTKSIVNGVGGNNGMFVTIVDPYDALKYQRLLANPENGRTLNTKLNPNSIAYLGAQSDYAWKTMFKTEINTLNSLQRVKNADGLWVGEVNTVPGKEQLMDSWSTPLSDVYENVSISKSLMGMFTQIPLTDTGKTGEKCTIDKQYSTYVIVSVCKTMINPTDGKITVGIVESFFGSLFDEKNPQNGMDLFIGNIINANSKYIEFYKNHYVAPQEVFNTTVRSIPQFYIKDSAELNNACKFVGIDQDSYDVDNIYFDAEGKRLPSCPTEIVYNYNQYIKAINAANIFVFNKKTTILYNNHPYAEFSSFSKKESQKIIADTTGLFGKEMGTTANIANNFIKDIDRCINFIKNVDAIPIYFVADAGLSTIAQFCDNISWDKGGNNGYGKWVTQNFDPDNDPDSEDRYITDYTSVATWRKIVDKLDQISREIRKDCMTIIDAPRQLTLDGAAPKIRKSRPDRSWNDVIGEKLIYISGINSSYTAGYYNWLRTTDTFTGKSFWLPPTCKIIGNYMYLNIINAPWLAPAGHSYGTVPGIHSISHNPDPNEEDQIYLKSWNYVKQYPFEGFIIEGQKTTLTKNSAFNRVNVRTLFLDLERFTYNVSKRFKYTVNNSYTREQFVQTLKPRFDDYVARGGIYDYRIICDESNNTPESIDANELRCAIYIKPARLIEYILIDFVCTKTGANLDEITL